MMLINAVVIDDDPLARAAIQKLLETESDIRVVGEAADGASALALMNTAALDLAFVDVDLPDINGFEVLRRLSARARPAAIFTTGHHEFAAEAFDLHAIDYLLKPFRDARFHDALGRARRHLRQPSLATIAAQMSGLVQRWNAAPASLSGAPVSGPVAEQQFMAKSGSDIHVFKPDQIRWVEGQGDYLKIHSTLGSALVRETMRHFLGRATAGTFVRVHKSAIVNLRYARRLVPLNSGDYRLELTDGTPVRVSRNFFAQLKTALGH